MITIIGVGESITGAVIIPQSLEKQKLRVEAAAPNMLYSLHHAMLCDRKQIKKIKILAVWGGGSGVP